jgi:uncharacterized repeat protein (TIGR03803 family)
MAAQNSVPPTAVQAAQSPAFASKLHPPVGGAHLIRSPHKRSPASPQGQTLYDNGPYNGTTDAWAIDFGFAVSDSFTVPGGSTIQGLSLVYWDASTSDLLTSVDMALGSTSFGGSFQTSAGVTNIFLGINQYGYALYQADVTFSGAPWSGAGYITLQNACTTSGCSVSNPVYWDENSGVGCTSPGCPSSAYESAMGSIPSESFTMEGGGGPPICFESGGNLQIIYSFTPQQAGQYGQEGVTIDSAGNLYGTNPGGGDNSAGLAYKLSHSADWVFDPLFSFFGGSNGGQPTGVIKGPNGTLYGGAEGGIQNCGSDGSQYCGLAFNLRPQPTACLTALCGWTENVPYRFSSESDGSGAINVSASDHEGNLYGTTSTGGAFGAGTVFELTPSGGGWTKTTLYSFTGGADGTTPSQVLVGNDGNLYGVAGAMYSNGVVFQLAPSGGQWTESVLYAFSGEQAPPGSLVQDGAGNLYGVVPSWEYGPIFTLQKTGSGWTFSEYLPGSGHSCSPGPIGYDWPINLAIDGAGNLYGTGTGGTQILGSFGKRSPGAGTCSYNYIFKASYDGTWHYRDLDFLPETVFTAGGSLAVDRSGNLYGTTSDCGTYNSGTVWQVSP